MSVAMEELIISRRSHEIVDILSADDFETASIRSAAPSYRSEAPTLHYTVPHTDGSLLPPYTAPPAGSADRVVAGSRHRSGPSSSTSRRAASSAGNEGGFGGNSMQSGRGGTVPSLTQFRIPSWSTISTSPNARLYHSVALRRVAAAEHASAAAEIGGLMRRLAVIERMEQEEAAASRRMAEAAANRAAAAAGANNSASNGASGNTPRNTRQGSNNSNSSSSSSSSSNNNSSNNSSSSSRSSSNSNSIWRSSGSLLPLEDPYVVGEAAARRARSDRITRENQTHAEEALAREDRRWDWFLGQVRNRQSSSLGTHTRLRRRMDPSMLSPVSVRHGRARRV